MGSSLLDGLERLGPWGAISWGPFLLALHFVLLGNLVKYNTIQYSTIQLYESHIALLNLY